MQDDEARVFPSFSSPPDESSLFSLPRWRLAPGERGRRGTHLFLSLSFADLFPPPTPFFFFLRSPDDKDLAAGPGETISLFLSTWASFFLLLILPSSSRRGNERTAHGREASPLLFLLGVFNGFFFRAARYIGGIDEGPLGFFPPISSPSFFSPIFLAGDAPSFPFSPFSSPSVGRTCTRKGRRKRKARQQKCASHPLLPFLSLFSSSFDYHFLSPFFLCFRSPSARQQRLKEVGVLAEM